MRNNGLTVLFFASIRERLNTDRLQLALLPTVAAVIDSLNTEHGAQWGEVLRAANVIVAINQRVGGLQDELSDGDELAFFPPVTGG